MSKQRFVAAVHVPELLWYERNLVLGSGELGVSVVVDELLFSLEPYSNQNGFNRLQSIRTGLSRTMTRSEFSCCCFSQQIAELLVCVSVKYGRRTPGMVLARMGVSDSFLFNSSVSVIYSQWMKISEMNRKITAAQDKYAEADKIARKAFQDAELAELVAKDWAYYESILKEELDREKEWKHQVEIMDDCVVLFVNEYESALVRNLGLIANDFKSPGTKSIPTLFVEDCHDRLVIDRLAQSSAAVLSEQSYMEGVVSDICENVRPAILASFEDRCGYPLTDYDFSDNVTPVFMGGETSDYEQFLNTIEIANVENYVCKAIVPDLPYKSKYHPETIDVHSCYPYSFKPRILSVSWKNDQCKHVVRVVVMTNLGYPILDLRYPGDNFNHQSYLRWLRECRRLSLIVLAGCDIVGVNLPQHLSVLGIGALPSRCYDIMDMPEIVGGNCIPSVLDLRTRYGDVFCRRDFVESNEVSINDGLIMALNDEKMSFLKHSLREKMRMRLIDDKVIENCLFFVFLFRRFYANWYKRRSRNVMVGG